MLYVLWSLGEYQSDLEKSYEGNLWLDLGGQPFGIQWLGFIFLLLLFFKDPLLTRYACSYVLTPLCWELPCLFCSFQHALLPPCIQSFTSPAQSSLLFYDIFSVTCVPSEATSTTPEGFLTRLSFDPTLPHLKHFATPAIAMMLKRVTLPPSTSHCLSAGPPHNGFKLSEFCSMVIS